MNSADQSDRSAREWLAQPTLARLWDLLHARLERNGVTAWGRLRINDATESEREALSLLLGRPLSAGAISVSLEDLDSRLRSGAPRAGLVEIVSRLRGPIADRRAARSARVAARSAIMEAGEAALAEAELSGEWAVAWLDDVRRGGSLSRLPVDRGVELIRQAVAVLDLCVRGDRVRGDRVRGDASPVGRGELAQRVTGTAHGLDDNTLLSRVVLRGLALAHDRPPPADARSRRELWKALAGVTVDSVSSTVLASGLRPLGDHWVARQLRERADAGAEIHLTARDARRLDWSFEPGTEIFVCENPRVAEAAADAGCARPVVCTFGNPTTAALALLDAMGLPLAYHGDFDWAGVAIAGRLISRYARDGRYGARPWRMRASDYESHVALARERGTPLLPLSGRPVPTPWDPELEAAMISLGVAVQEESVLELLVGDLR